MSEVVMIVGFPASGKSSLAQELVDKGYVRINRDEEGGAIKDLLSPASYYMKSGKNIVLDNTFPTIESREPFIELAKKIGVPIRCVWLTTSCEDAQLNACMRMLQKTGKILSPDEIKAAKDPNLFPPAVLFAYKSKIEGKTEGLKYPGKQYPTVEHGFISVDKRSFTRVWGAEYVNKAIITDYDGTLRESTGPNEWPTKPEEVRVISGRGDVLKKYQDQGYLILGASNQSACAKGLSLEAATACFERTNELLGVKIEYQFCPHKVPPIICFCRKPCVGMGAHFIFKHKLLPSNCIMVGDQTSDATFAQRCGFQFKAPSEFYGT
jgi:HAD superfamily hydrolase (TIGR01662 family)